jgi:hypothetical protein
MRFLSILALFTVPVFAQKSENDPAVLQSLLTEVQQLRLAIERSTLLGTRTQLALSRLQIQEQTATRLAAQLNDVRHQANNALAERTRMSERLRDLETRSGHDANQEQMDSMKHAKYEIERMTAEEQEYRTRESELSGQFQAAQNQVAETRARISEMEQSLDAAIQQLLKPR